MDLNAQAQLRAALASLDELGSDTQDPRLDQAAAEGRGGN